MSAERTLTNLETHLKENWDLGEFEASSIEIAERLFSKGEEAKAIYIVTEGRVALRKYVDNSEVIEEIDSTAKDTVTTALLGPEDIIGLEGLLGAYSTTAVAEEPSKFIKIPVDVILPIIIEDPDLMMQIGQLLAKEVRRVEDNIMEQKMDDAPRKVARSLLKYLRFANAAEETEKGSRVPATQEEIAQFAGVSRDAASKAIINFAERGLIYKPLNKSKRKNARIKKPEALAKKFNLPNPVPRL